MKDKQPVNWVGLINRQCRVWHGYLSAASFLALLFFATTGLVLNHPEWTKAPTETIDHTIVLAPSDIEAIRNATDHGAALIATIARDMPLRGFAKDAAMDGDTLFVRLRGAKGSSDLRADLASRTVRVSVEQENVLGILNALHRGVLAGLPWRVAIDVIAIVLIVMALLGFALFLLTRQRIVTTLVLLGASAVSAVTIYTFLVS